MKKDRKDNLLSSYLTDQRTPVFLCLLAFGVHLLNVLFVRNLYLQVPLGILSVFLIPGYLWLDVLSGKNRVADVSERIATSVAISISLVILVTTFSSLVLKLPLNGATTAGILSTIVLSGLAARRIFLGKIA